MNAAEVAFVIWNELLMYNDLLPHAVAMFIPFWLQLRRNRICFQFLSVALIYLASGGLALWALVLAPESVARWLGSASGSDMRHPTVLTVFQPYHFHLAMGIIMGCLGFATWVQARSRAVFHPRLQRGLFWALLIGLILPQILPRLILDPANDDLEARYNAFASLSILQSMSVLFAIMSVCVFVILLAYSLSRRAAFGLFQT